MERQFGIDFLNSKVIDFLVTSCRNSDIDKILTLNTLYKIEITIIHYLERLLQASFIIMITLMMMPVPMIQMHSKSIIQKNQFEHPKRRQMLKSTFWMKRLQQMLKSIQTLRIQVLILQALRIQVLILKKKCWHISWRSSNRRS